MRTVKELKEWLDKQPEGKEVYLWVVHTSEEGSGFISVNDEGNWKNY